MLKECTRCRVDCIYLNQKDKFMKAVADGKMDAERALEQIEIWRQEAVSVGCDELKALPNNYGDE